MYAFDFGVHAARKGETKRRRKDGRMRTNRMRSETSPVNPREVYQVWL